MFFFKRKSKEQPQKRMLLNTNDQKNLLSSENKSDSIASEPPTVSYDPHKIFVIAKSEDNNLQLFRDLFLTGETFRIFYKNNTGKILIMKEYPRSPDQVLDVFNCALSSSGFAVSIDTYFSNDPHVILNFYLYDNSGVELFHKSYTEGGARCYKFSPSGRYFVLMDFSSFYVYDMIDKKLNTFSPEDFASSSSTDFIIFEDRHLISYCYTHHPDKPWYHFTFSGNLIEEGAFRAQIDKLTGLSAKNERYYTLLEEIQQTERPLTSDMYNHYMSELYSFSTDPDYQDSAVLYRRMGELELDMNHKKEALEYFEKALSLDSQVGVKRIASKLKKELDISD